jgi:hypothetical protein
LFSDYYLYGIISAQTLQDLAETKTMKKGGEKIACPYVDIGFYCPQANLPTFLLTTTKEKKQLAYFEQLSRSLKILPQQWANIELIAGQYLKLKKGKFFGVGQLQYPQGLQILLPESYDSLDFISSPEDMPAAYNITILARKQSKWAIYNLLGKAITKHSYSQYRYQAQEAAFLLQNAKNKKWGLAKIEAAKLRPLLPFSYDSLTILSNKSGNINDAIALKKGKWGVLMDIYKLPQQRLAFQYQQILVATATEDNIEYLALREGKTEYWANGQLRPIIGEFSEIGRNLSPNLRLVKNKNKFGLLQTKTLTLVCPTIYDEIREFSTDTSQSAPPFLLLRAQKLIGLYAIDRETIIIPATYDSINYLNPQIVQVWRGGKVGCFDLYNNTEIISPEFDQIQALNNTYLPNSYLLRQGENWGLWRQGAQILPCQYNSFSIDSRQEFLLLNQDTQTVFIDIKRLGQQKNSNFNLDSCALIAKPIATHFAPKWKYNIGQTDSFSRINIANERVYITTNKANAPFLMLDNKGNALPLPAVLADFKANEKPLSFVISADEKLLFYTNAALQLHALKLKNTKNAATYQPLWQQNLTQDLTEIMSAGFCLIDIDKDKKEDPVLIFNKKIIAYSTNSSKRLWAYAAPFSLAGQAYTADLNKDKIPDIITANLQISGKNGQPIGAINSPAAAPRLPSIFVPTFPLQSVRFSNKKPLQTLIATDNGYLLILPSSSNNIQKILRLPAPLFAPPIVADIDGDGLLELLIHCNDGFLYCYKSPF